MAVPGGQVVDAGVGPSSIVDGQHPVRVVRLKCQVRIDFSQGSQVWWFKAEFYTSRTSQQLVI